MLKNFLLISLRSIIKNKGGSYLNLLGLALGMAACLYIFNYIYYELTFDTHAASTVRVETHVYNGEILQTRNAFTSVSAGPTVAKTVAAKSFTRLQPFSEEGSAQFKFDTSDSTSKKVYVKTAYITDQSVFSVFDLSLQGESKTITDQNRLFLSRSVANEIAAKIGQSPSSLIGAILKSGGKGILDNTYTISGVFEDRPSNTHLPFDALVISGDGGLTKTALDETLDTYTYLKVSESQQFQTSISSGLDQAKWYLRPIDQIHTATDISNEPTAPVSKTLLLFLAIIGLVIMILACTNYVNNAIINSIYRAKEIGIRKVLGIRPSQLILTFIGEAFVLNLIAGILSIGAFYIGVRLSTTWTAFEYPAGEISTFVQLVFIAVLVITATLLSSIYPAYYLSSLNPISSLRSKISLMDANQMGGVNTIIKSLLVFQLAASLLFVTSVYIVYKQLNYLESQEKQPFDMQVSGIFPGASGVGTKFTNFAMGFIEEMERGGSIENVQLSNLSKGKVKTAQQVSFLRPEDPHFTESENQVNFYVIDYSYWRDDTSHFLAGKNFKSQFGENPNDLIVNESTMAQLGYQQADSLLNRFVETKGGRRRIIGIIKNQSLNEPSSVYATGFRFQTFVDLTLHYPGNAKESVTDFIAGVEHLLGSRLPFLYFFDRQYQKQRTTEKTMLGLFSFFSLLAILISSIGMMGLSLFVTQKRSKEIGIRKILGAQTRSILSVLLVDFLKLLFYASLIAIPILLVGSKVWLENYAYRITVGPITLGMPLLLMIGTCLAVIMEKCWKAASASPVSVLRD